MADAVIVAELRAVRSTMLAHRASAASIAAIDAEIERIEACAAKAVQGEDTGSRIRDDDELTGFDGMQKILGGPSISACYEDPELMSLRISMTPPGRRTKRVCFIVREVLALRAKRAALAGANAEQVMAEVEARVKQRRTKQRLRWPYRAKAKAAAKKAIEVEA